GSGYGGLEHRASSALICSRNDLPRTGSNGMTREYRGFLGLVSHEYFHLWNVKRITAERFAASDLAAEAYTADLWHYEGVTSYYDDLSLLRAEIIDAPAYLDLLAETATRLSRAPGREVHALAALCLDLHLRLNTPTTLDAVMRELWRRYGREQRPVPERGLEQVASELA